MSALRQSSDQILANFLPDAVFILSKEGQVLWWNNAAIIIFNLAEMKESTFYITDLIDVPISLESSKRYPIEIDLPESRRISLSVRSYLDDHLLLVAQDITPIYRLEQMRQDFLANVSHELRTPLTVIHGYVETLLDQNRPALKSLKPMFAQMYQQTLRMENLVNDLLLLSRLEADVPEEKNYQPVNIVKMLNLICQEAQVLSGDYHHHFHLETDDALTIQGLERELHSAFSNIIFNAVKYTPAKGEIFIHWVKQNNRPCFSVKDTGIGIEKNHIPRLTERFYRVDKARSRTSGGTGLGLAIVKHVLIRHKAILKIESIPGKGSIFSCIFPKRLIVR